MNNEKVNCPHFEDVITTKTIVNTIHKDLQEIKAQLHDFVDAADRKYASKERVNKVEEEMTWQRRTIIFGSIIFIIAIMANMSFTAWLSNP